VSDTASGRGAGRVSDAIVLTSQQPDDPRRAPRSSAPSGGGQGARSPAQSLVPEGARFEGTVAFAGEARLAGRVVGPVEGRGRLELLPGGSVEGDIRADELVVAGRVQGRLEVADRLELRAEAHVEGPVSAGSLEMHEGAVLDGELCIGGNASRADS
jgi:cytoskeletal protein CcmA (bactofilin family)